VLLKIALVLMYHDWIVLVL